jgi:hypothetical protein
MDHIDTVLASQSVDKSLNPAVRVALAMGKKTLNRYYDLTDSSEVYRIAMSKFFVEYIMTYSPSTTVLHPRHKLAYFAAAGWEPDWVATAREIVRDEFDRSYPAQDVEEISDVNQAVKPPEVMSPFVAFF